MTISKHSLAQAHSRNISVGGVGHNVTGEAVCEGGPMPDTPRPATFFRRSQNVAATDERMCGQPSPFETDLTKRRGS